MRHDINLMIFRKHAAHFISCIIHSKIYNATNPFNFMEMISMQGKANFFERRESSYQKAGVMAGLKNVDTSFTMDADF